MKSSSHAKYLIAYKDEEAIAALALSTPYLSAGIGKFAQKADHSFSTTDRSTCKAFADRIYFPILNKASLITYSKEVTPRTSDNKSSRASETAQTGDWEAVKSDVVDVDDVGIQTT